MSLTNIKSSVFLIIGAVGSVFVNILGGWDMALQTLLIFMAIDYITGLILAGIFHKSQKSATGSLSSKIGFKGICKKVVIVMLVMIGYRVDITFGTDVVRYGIIIAFSVNELTSITENAGLMGIPLPSILTQAIDLLKKEKVISTK